MFGLHIEMLAQNRLESLPPDLAGITFFRLWGCRGVRRGVSGCRVWGFKGVGLGVVRVCLSLNSLESLPPDLAGIQIPLMRCKPSTQNGTRAFCLWNVRAVSALFG